MIPIYGLQKTTLLDYPGHVSSTIFLGKCNYRCIYCQNSSLLDPRDISPAFTEEDIYTHLRKRKGILEGVCITGGEPTLTKELKSFIQNIKAMDYLVKLDTNGTNPDLLGELLKENLLDMVSMDIKNSLPHYGITIGKPNYNTKAVEESVRLLKNSSIPYEFRTTLVKELHTKEDLLSISQWLQGPDSYFLQNYRDSEEVLTKGLHGFSSEELKELLSIVLPLLPNAALRGVDI